MRTVKLLLAVLTLAILATSVGYATVNSANLTKLPVVAQPHLLAPLVNIESIKIAPANLGNSMPINLTVNVTQMGQTICKLNASNFKVEMPPLGTNASAVYVKSVKPISPPCNYAIEIAPKVINGKQDVWVNGNGLYKLDFYSNGKLSANATFALRMHPGTMTITKP